MEKKKKKKKRRKGLIVILVLLLAGGGGVFGFTRLKKETGGTEYEFTRISKGNIVNTVSSTGTLEPMGVVNVLAQMNGTVETVYVDYNDTVTKNQRLLDLNTDILRIEKKTAEANLMQAQANFDYKQLEYNNNVKLFEKKLISEFELQGSKTNLAVARANLDSAEANLERVGIELNQYALILSPIDGIVLDRNVDEGDTVVSGNTNTALFSIAEDLSRMEIHVDVDELDISNIKKGQEVQFTVDAYPDEKFTGTVREVRLVPQTVSNIITYTVIVDAENRETKLLPGMTANVEFIVEKKENVFLVPSAAFRFSPSQEDAAAAMFRTAEARISELPEDQQEGAREDLNEMKKMMEAAAKAESGSGGGLIGGGMPFPGGGRPGGRTGSADGGTSGNGIPVLSGPGAAGGPNRENLKQLWYFDDSRELSFFMVETGADDGSNTEVMGPDVAEGKELILRIKAER